MVDFYATTHACTRYAQRVLGKNVGEAHLRGDAALRGRCAREIARLLERAQWEVRTEDAEIWIAGTRALVIKNACVLTVLTGPTSRWLSKKTFRRNTHVQSPHPFVEPASSRCFA